MEGIGILHDVAVWYDKTELALDFHIFEVQDFDVLIGHPVEKMFQNISPLGTLDITLGGKDISLPILWSKDSMIEPTPQEEIVDEVLTSDFGTCQGGVLRRRKSSALYNQWIWEDDHVPRSKILLTEGEEVDQIFWLRFSKSYLIFRSSFYS